MLDQIAAAFDRKDYQTAAQLVQERLRQAPADPWARLYAGRLQEVAGKLDEAAAIYRQLLPEATHVKLVAQARQGIQRLEALRRERRQQAIAEAAASSGNDLGFLVLAAVSGEARLAATQNFARVMKLDAYTARSLLPSRGWKLYRTGSAAELQVYAQELQAVGVPVVWASLAALQAIRVFQVSAFRSEAATASVVCRDEQDRQGSLTFAWSEVTQRVEGRLPIFEQVLDLGYRDRLERKESIQDYAQVCDLHLPNRRCILRLHDSQYDFQQGASLAVQGAVAKPDRSTLRTHWNGLMTWVEQRSPQAPVWSDFTPFAESMVDFAAPLSHVIAHIRILRQTETYWDSAFQLYSGLTFLRSIA